MKKILLLMLALSALLSLYSCSENGEKIEYKYYVDSGMADDISSEYESEIFLTAYELNIYDRYSFKSYKDENAPKSRTFELDGKSYTVTYGASLPLNGTDGTKDNIQEYILKTDDAHYIADFHGETGKLVNFMTLKGEKVEGVFSEDDALNKSKEFIVNTFGDDSLSGYDKVTVSKSDGKIHVRYTKVIHEIECQTDYISVIFDFNGGICNFNAIQFGVVDDKKITKSRIKEAESTLIASIPEEFKISESRKIVVDFTTGICYLSIGSNKKSDGNYYSFMINLN